MGNPYLAFSLIPAVYSKAQTAEQIAEHIKVYPSQICNTVEAIDHTLEFTEQGTIRPVGSLSEFHEADPRIFNFYIYPLKGGGLLHVVCDEKKNFHVKELFIQ